MCGLFGVIPCGTQTPELSQRLRMLIMFLGILNDSRGGHSWGLWSRDGEIKRGLYKIGASGATTLSRYATDWDPISGNWICGHTRYATHGEKTVENSHPFEFEHLILAHNGVVTVHGDIEAKNHVVDSGQIGQIVSQTIAKFPGEPFAVPFAEAISTVSGSCGLLLSNGDGELRAYASSQELHIAYAPWGYAISSTDTHLEAALQLAGLDYHHVEAIKDGMLMAPWYGEEDVHAPAKPSSYKKGWRSYGAYDADEEGWWDRWRNGEFSHYGRATSTPGIVKQDPPALDFDRRAVRGTGDEDTSTTTIADGIVCEAGDDEPFEDTDTYGHPCELCGEQIGIGGGFTYDQSGNCTWMCCASCRSILLAEEAELKKFCLS